MAYTSITLENPHTGGVKEAPLAFLGQSFSLASSRHYFAGISNGQQSFSY